MPIFATKRAAPVGSYVFRLLAEDLAPLKEASESCPCPQMFSWLTRSHVLHGFHSCYAPVSALQFALTCIPPDDQLKEMLALSIMTTLDDSTPVSRESKEASAATADLPVYIHFDPVPNARLPTSSWSKDRLGRTNSQACLSLELQGPSTALIRQSVR